ncbi:hypothetical protein BCV69DRAFT_312016 [Microstroma glucosiphilum]|uniref:Uncharacterized protein n=1 Tax=Pseudomicrostroma glucosiphilum TaxID=1684307 RepID=A0A316UAS2_9BASI|nr:hypothetical protein BCV69DRAFT_312016 [Pseudomicrostroma glucosiphilum]PWN21513.1 hypothetical protein BCV69DRAFT_312016 [Pseudomicrostroma glucosiphilum]
MASMSSVPPRQSSLGLGRPSSTGSGSGSSPSSSATLTPSSSLSLSLSRSSSSTLSSPLSLAKSHYTASAHHFIHRQPLEALHELEEAWRLLFIVIAPDQKEIRGSGTWQGVRDKTVILWLTLLVSLWKTGGSVATQQRGKELTSHTTALLKQRDPEDFLKGLTGSVLQAYSAMAGDVQGANGDSRAAAARHEERKVALSLLPASVAASVIMASLGVEEFPSSGSSTSPQSSVSAKSMPLSRHLAEDILQAQSAPLASPAPASAATSEARARLVSSYSRVLELYAIHILGVRCAQWEEADQVVRLSLLEDEERAKLLVALDRAREHVVTRPERRASAKLAGEQAYELEKQRRKAVEKGLQQQGQQKQTESNGAFMRSDTTKTTSTVEKEQPRRSRPPVGKHRYSSSSASSSSSSVQPSSETESDSTITVNKPAKHRSSHSHSEGSTSSQRGDNESTSSTTAAAQAFASTRSALSTRIAKDAHRDSASSNERGSVAPRKSTGTSADARAASASSLIQTLRSFLALDRLPLSGSVLLSVLGPLLVLLFSLKRLSASRGRSRPAIAVTAGGGGGGAGGRGSQVAARKAGGSNEAGLLSELIQRLWNTVRMGTKVTHL